MRRIERLRREAVVACEAKGHRMGRFLHAIDMRQSRCIVCGDMADISGNESCIYGRATTKRCRPTISYIAGRNAAAGGYYFSRETMQYFGQRRSDFKVHVKNGRVFVQASRIMDKRYYMGETFAEFNPRTGDVSGVGDFADPNRTRAKAKVREFLESL